MSIITARFDSICSICRKLISKGDQVEWSPGSYAKHVACVAQVVKTGPPLTPPQAVNIDDLFSTPMTEFRVGSLKLDEWPTNGAPDTRTDYSIEGVAKAQVRRAQEAFMTAMYLRFIELTKKIVLLWAENLSDTELRVVMLELREVPLPVIRS